MADVTTGVSDESVTPWRLNVCATGNVVLFTATIAKRPLAASLNAVMPMGLLLPVTSTR